MRPLGIPAYEDKLVQHALKNLLEAIYEQDFHGFLLWISTGTKHASSAEES